MAIIAQNYGAVFVRDPFTGTVVAEHAEQVPAGIYAALWARWGDLEALLAEQCAPDLVQILLQT